MVVAAAATAREGGSGGVFVGITTTTGAGGGDGGAVSVAFIPASFDSHITCEFLAQPLRIALSALGFISRVDVQVTEKPERVCARRDPLPLSPLFHSSEKLKYFGQPNRRRRWSGELSSVRLYAKKKKIVRARSLFEWDWTSGQGSWLELRPPAPISIPRFFRNQPGGEKSQVTKKWLKHVMTRHPTQPTYGCHHPKTLPHQISCYTMTNTAAFPQS